MKLEFLDIVFGFFILVILVVGSIMIAKFTYTEPVYEYSEGERIGVLRKLSKKGVFHKTYEGELMMNVGSMKLDTFNFSVANQATADSLLLHIGKEMKLHYKEYLIVPFSMGSTDYLIDGYQITPKS